MLGLDVQDIDYRRYPDMGFQKAWIRMYLEEVAIIEGVFTRFIVTRYIVTN